MKKQLLFVLYLLAVGFIADAKDGTNAWKQAGKAARSEGVRRITPDKYILYSLDKEALQSSLLNIAPTEESPAVIEVPMPDGNYRSFKVWRSSLLPKKLADKYPAIRTFDAIAMDDNTVTAKIDLTVFGFHAMVMDGANTYFIDPYTTANDGLYQCYYRRDHSRPAGERMACMVTDEKQEELGSNSITLTKNGLPPMTPLNKINGAQKRKLILALVANIEYSAAVSTGPPDKVQVLSAMSTSMNRVNGVYERELGVSMEFHPDEDTLIFLTGEDTYTNGSGSQMMNRNQKVCDSMIGALNYDIGHVFSTGGGGIADLASVCDLQNKAQGVTGQSNPKGDAFDIDYVAHEMGHQLGATHTFAVNFNAGSCTGNATLFSAYEPGSGSTIMGYAGLCGAANDFEQHSQDYFHAKNLDQVTHNFTINGGNCILNPTASGNVPPSVPAFTHIYYIPYLTPFELTAPDAIDNDHDVLNYCWEQYNLGNGLSLDSTKDIGPLFRSFPPATSTTRVFPALNKLVKNQPSPGEKLPTVARKMNFRLTVRDMYNGTGSFNFPDDSIVLNVINTGAPFKVSAPNTTTAYWQIGSTVTVTWDVANTTAAPVNASNVDILLSIDEGYNYQFVLASNTPNDGSETITVPYAPTLSARVKVKGSGNVFFDISNENFKINTWPAEIKDTFPVELELSPNPATDKLSIKLTNADEHELRIVNTLGQMVWSSTIVKKAEVQVGSWAKGIYHLQLINKTNKERLTRKFVVY